MTDKEIDALRTSDGQKILKLSDVFDKYGDTVTYVIELKGDASQTGIFAALVKKYAMENNIIVQSFVLSALEELEPVFPDMPKMYLINNSEGFDAALTDECIDILAVSKELMSKDNCDSAHRAGKLFNVWTLNSTADIKTAIELNVDSYFTNYTAKALALEKLYRK